MEYIINPNTGERVNIFSNNGKSILQNYFNKYIQGGSSVDSDEMGEIDWKDESFFSTETTPRNTPLPPSPPTFENARITPPTGPIPFSKLDSGDMEEREFTPEYLDNTIADFNKKYLEALSRWPEYRDELPMKYKYTYIKKNPNREPHLLVKLLSLFHAKINFFRNYFGMELNEIVNEEGLDKIANPGQGPDVEINPDDYTPFLTASEMKELRGGMKRNRSKDNIIEVMKEKIEENPITVEDMIKTGATETLDDDVLEYIKIVDARLRYENERKMIEDMVETHIDEVPLRKSRRLALKKNQKKFKPLKDMYSL